MTWWAVQLFVTEKELAGKPARKKARRWYNIETDDRNEAIREAHEIADDAGEDECHFSYSLPTDEYLDF